MNNYIELLRINNCLSKEDELFFKENLSKFLAYKNDDIIIMQNSRGIGGNIVRRPDFSDYFNEIKDWESENRKSIIFIKDYLYDFIWDCFFKQENLISINKGDEEWTQIDYNKDSFIFYSKRGIYIMIVSYKFYKEINNYVNENTSWDKICFEEMINNKNEEL